MRLVFVLLLAGAGSVQANDLRIDNVQLIARPNATGELRAVFDLSWRNAWHNDRNHDAAWVFLKINFGDGGYVHLRLAADGHAVTAASGTETPGARIDLAPDHTGFFIYPDGPHRGDVQWRLSIRLDREAFDNRWVSGRLEAYRIEMVYIPEGPFTLGDPDTTALQFGAFYRTGADGTPDGLVRLTSEAAISVGAEQGRLDYRNPQAAYQGDREGPVPAAFPKGYQAFYAMKYEVTQGQYAAFLNTLSDDETFERFSFGGRSYFEKRGTMMNSS